MQLVYKNTQNIKNTILLTYNYSKPQISNPNIMKNLQPIKAFILILTVLLITTSCSKEELGRDQNFAGITVSLKSTTVELNRVFLDIEDVQVKVKEEGNSPNAWVSLNAINTGSHNVSNLSGDSELLLVNHFEIRPTYIYEIRLVLADNNFINVNDTLIHLDVTESGNATPSNLVKRGFEGNHIYDIIINVDIDESISFNDDENMMILNPKLQTEIRRF